MSASPLGGASAVQAASSAPARGRTQSALVLGGGGAPPRAAAVGGGRSETLLALAAVAILGVMVLPMPPLLLDMLLALSVALALVVFLFSIHIERPLEFSAFPSLLLLITLLRLALNVASTRLILLKGHEGSGSVGHVIEAFGQFVVGGNTAVGVIIFAILVIINFVVITKGATRIGEVTARFTLDAMPGKQMAIDADLAAGLINEQEARSRRRMVEQEADFFGSMDGAGKFVRGDAVAGLVITAVNLVGGLGIGVLQRGMDVGEAAATYAILSVGDGLVSQMPALLTSVAAGLVTTRAATAGALGAAVQQQLFGSRPSLMTAAAVLAALGLVPGMPHFAFLTLAIALFLAARAVPEKKVGAASLEPERPTTATERAEIESQLPVDLLEIEVGFELVPLVDSERDGSLLRRVTATRKQLAQDLGILVPPIHMRDNLRLRGSEYRILLSGNEVARGELRMGRLLAMAAVGSSVQLPGEAVVEPAFGLPARWISSSERERAELNGYTVVDPSTVLATHLGEILGAHAHELVGRAELQQLLDLHGRDNGRVIEELLPNLLSMAQFVKVLRALLRERISIRDFRTILEALADHAAETKDPEALTEVVRQRLGKQIAARHRGADGALPALVLAPSTEAVFRRMQTPSLAPGVEATEVHALSRAFETAARSLRQSEDMPVILTAADIRPGVSLFANRLLPGVSVLSYREIDAKLTIKNVGVIGGDRAALNAQGAT